MGPQLVSCGCRSLPEGGECKIKGFNGAAARELRMRPIRITPPVTRVSFNGAAARELRMLGARGADLLGVGGFNGAAARELRMRHDQRNARRTTRELQWGRSS